MSTRSLCDCGMLTARWPMLANCLMSVCSTLGERGDEQRIEQSLECGSVWKQEAAAAGGRAPLRCVILDLSPVPHVDATAVRSRNTASTAPGLLPRVGT